MMKRDGVKVFFVDLRMPIMNGMDLCREIKKVDPDAHVYALSAFSSAYTDEQFADAGFDGRFNKPFRVQTILGACEEAFEKVAAEG